MENETRRCLQFLSASWRPHSGECTECIFDTGKLNKIWDAETDGELNDILGADLDDNLGEWEEMWSNDGRDSNGKEILEPYNANGYDSYGFYILGKNRDGIYHADVSKEWQGAVDPIIAANWQEDSSAAN